MAGVSSDVLTPKKMDLMDYACVVMELIYKTYEEVGYTSTDGLAGRFYEGPMYLGKTKDCLVLEDGNGGFRSLGTPYGDWRILCRGDRRTGDHSLAIKKIFEKLTVKKIHPGLRSDTAGYMGACWLITGIEGYGKIDHPEVEETDLNCCHIVENKLVEENVLEKLKKCKEQCEKLYDTYKDPSDVGLSIIELYTRKTALFHRKLDELGIKH